MFYAPVKKGDQLVNCFLSEKLNLAFRVSCSEGQKSGKVKHSTVWQCYFCSNHYARKDRYDRHIENCAGHLGYVYNLNTQSLFMFEENLKYKGDIPLVAYIDFEITTPTDTCLDPENRTLYAVSFVIVFAFHPDLPQIDRVIIECSFGHSLQKLNDLSYLTCDQLVFGLRKKEKNSNLQNVQLQIKGRCRLLAKMVQC